MTFFCMTCSLLPSICAKSALFTVQSRKAHFVHFLIYGPITSKLGLSQCVVHGAAFEDSLEKEDYNYEVMKENWVCHQCLKAPLISSRFVNSKPSAGA